MTTPAQVIQNLLKLGVSVHDAFVNAQHNGPIKWDDFLRGADFKAIEANVKALLASLDQASIDGTLKAIDAKRDALLGGRGVGDLSPDELTNYFALLHTRTLLVHEWVSKRTNWQAFLQWLTEDGLPKIVSVAKVVIPLLL